ncbi:MAG: hypothetical protein ACYCX3_14565 [Thermoleophilia bacterium]
MPLILLAIITLATVGVSWLAKPVTSRGAIRVAMENRVYLDEAGSDYTYGDLVAAYADTSGLPAGQWSARRTKGDHYDWLVVWTPPKGAGVGGLEFGVKYRFWRASENEMNRSATREMIRIVRVGRP